jgi:hypothetical protein
VNNIVWFAMGVGVGWFLWGRSQAVATPVTQPGLLPFLNPQTGLPQLPTQPGLMPLPAYATRTSAGIVQ